MPRTPPRLNGEYEILYSPRFSHEPKRSVRRSGSATPDAPRTAAASPQPGHRPRRLHPATPAPETPAKSRRLGRDTVTPYQPVPMLPTGTSRIRCQAHPSSDEPSQTSSGSDELELEHIRYRQRRPSRRHIGIRPSIGEMTFDRAMAHIRNRDRGRSGRNSVPVVTKAQLPSLTTTASAQTCETSAERPDLLALLPGFFDDRISCHSALPRGSCPDYQWAVANRLRSIPPCCGRQTQTSVMLTPSPRVKRLLLYSCPPC